MPATSMPKILPSLSDSATNSPTNCTQLWPKSKFRQSKQRLQRRWVPKKTLQAQNFYQGNQRLWVPKTKITSIPKTQTEPKTITQPRISRQSKWIPKKLLQAQQFYNGNSHIWLPKTHQRSENQTAQSTTRPTAQTQLQKPTLNVHNVSTKVCISEPTDINIKLNKGKGKHTST